MQRNLGWMRVALLLVVSGALLITCGCMSYGSHSTSRPAPDGSEQYARTYENKFTPAQAGIPSTFSIDVDTASYTMVRRYVANGKLPPPQAVRIEEMLNYFTYSYPEPQGDEEFSVKTEYSTCPWSPTHGLLLIGIKAKGAREANLSASNLVFLMDTSGSMNADNKMPLMKHSIKRLVEKLGTKDRISLISFASRPKVRLDGSTTETKDAILKAIDVLKTGGGTGGIRALEKAYEVALKNFIPNGNNRIILCTDGGFNSDKDRFNSLKAFVSEKKGTGVALTVLGCGSGDYRDDNLEMLADSGDGNYFYIDSHDEAYRVFDTALAGALETVAMDVKVLVDFNAGNVRSFRLIGYEDRMIDTRKFIEEDADAGELGAGHCVTALYEIIAPESEYIEDEVKSKYTKESTDRPKTSSGGDLCTLRIRYKSAATGENKKVERVIPSTTEAFSAASEDFRFASAVAEAGLVLRDSKLKDRANIAHALSVAKVAQSADPEGLRADFISLLYQIIRRGK
ncbi:MAG: von Willebrand factor type A domain-containing protein [Candidatus Brocadiia bacterium]